METVHIKTGASTGANWKNVWSNQNEGAWVLTTLYVYFFKRSRAANSAVGDGIWQKLKLIHAFIVVLITCKNDEDSSKTESTRLLTTFLPL